MISLGHGFACWMIFNDRREEWGVRLDSQVEIKSVRKNEGYKVCVYFAFAYLSNPFIHILSYRFIPFQSLFLSGCKRVFVYV